MNLLVKAITTGILSRRAIRSTMAVVLMFCGATAAEAGQGKISLDDFRPERPIFFNFGTIYKYEWLKNLEGGGTASASVMQADGKSAAAAVHDAPTPTSEMIDTTYYTTQTGEPTLSGVKRTAWWTFRPASNGRLVLNTFSTFGSTGDTVLAVYTGSKLSSLKRVALSDNATVPGVSTKTSLVILNVVKGTDYHVQVGIRSPAANTYVSLSRILLPTGGGIVAQPVDYADYQDYVCSVASSSTNGCPTRRYIVINATTKSVVVTATNTLGGALKSPASFTIAAGRTALAQFVAASGFNLTTTRVIGGKFAFSAKTSGVETARAHAPGVVEVGYTTATTALTFTALPAIVTMVSGEFGATTFRVTNTGATDLAGCHLAADANTMVRWKAFNRTTYKVTGSENPIFALKAGASADIALEVAKRWSSTVADYDHSGSPASLNCAGVTTDRLDFDVTSPGPVAPPVIGVTLGATSPAKIGTAGLVTTVKALTPSATAALTLRARYSAPWNEGAANQQFKVAICPSTMSNAKCLKSTTTSLAVTATKGVVATYKLAIHAPTATLPTTTYRRVVDVVFEQTQAELGTMIVGGQAIDVRKP